MFVKNFGFFPDFSDILMAEPAQREHAHLYSKPTDNININAHVIIVTDTKATSQMETK